MNSFPLKIERFPCGPEALGFHQGMAVFVPLAVPEDEIEAAIYFKTKSYGRAKIEKILKPSPHRIEPPCLYFRKGCGGCQWQMASYEYQLRAKKEVLAETFERIGKISAGTLPLEDCERASEWNYRNKIQLPLKRIEGGRLLAGYFERLSHRIVDFEQCPVHLKMFDEPLQKLKRVLASSGLPTYDERTRQGQLRHLCLRGSERTGEILITLVSTRLIPESLVKKIQALNLKGLVGLAGNINAAPGNIVYGKETKTLYGNPFYSEKILDKTFHVSATSFFQTNTEAVEKVIQDLLAHLPSTLGTGIDAYCGGGIFSIFLASRAGKILGIEEDAANLSDARENQKLNQVSNVEWLEARTEDVISKTHGADFVMVDPPRQGLKPEVVQALLEKKPKRLIYLSCDPATLARDCGLLVRGGYKIERIKPFDFFPHTYHIETLSYLKI